MKTYQKLTLTLGLAALGAFTSGKLSANETGIALNHGKMAAKEVRTTQRSAFFCPPDTGKTKIAMLDSMKAKIDTAVEPAVKKAGEDSLSIIRVAVVVYIEGGNEAVKDSLFGKAVEFFDAAEKYANRFAEDDSFYFQKIYAGRWPANFKLGNNMEAISDLIKVKPRTAEICNKIAEAYGKEANLAYNRGVNATWNSEEYLKKSEQYQSLATDWTAKADNIGKPGRKK